MAENKLLEAFALLGLHEGDRIEIEDIWCNPYTVSGEALLDEVGDPDYISTVRVLNGEYKWRKLPWKPKEGDGYCFLIPRNHEVLTSGDGLSTHAKTFIGSFADLRNVAIGNYFRTIEEAEAKKDALIAKLKEAAE